jgi:hypothetical protein
MAHGWFNVDGAGGYDDLTSISNTSWCTAVGGAIYTTSTDLARLANALMHERSFLNSDTYAEMTDFVFLSGHDEPLVRGYGLGLLWFNASQLFGQELWGHGGNAIGYAAGMLYMTDYGVSIGIMDNTEHGDAMTVLGDIMAEIVDYLEGG